MQKRYQIDKQRAVQKFRRLATEVNPSVQMMLPMAGIVGLLQEGVGHLMREAGLLLMMGVMEEERRGLRTTRQQPIPVVYENIRIDTGFRADLVVEDKVIVEVKSVELLAPVHKKQLLTYLRLADKRLGLLINFHVALIKDGITRVVNGLEEGLTQSRHARQG